MVIVSERGCALAESPRGPSSKGLMGLAGVDGFSAGPGNALPKVRALRAANSLQR